MFKKKAVLEKYFGMKKGERGKGKKEKETEDLGTDRREKKEIPKVTESWLDG